jgi:tRNA pseudouridine55 synthase
MSAASTDLHGLLVIDKPRGITSRDAINRIERQLPRGTKIGHTGTLDPLATGVLVVCLGRATRLAEYVQAMNKTYQSTFMLGACSDTDDADGTVKPAENPQPLSLDQVASALQTFVGEIEQVPPAFSAVLVGGARAYDLARAGETVELKPRRVVVHEIKLLAYSWPNVDVEIRCGKGTYIRSIARDLGEKLGCRGLVAALRRTRVGPFRAEDTLPPDADLVTIRAHLRPASEAVGEMQRIDVTPEMALRLRQGQILPSGDAAAGEVAVFSDGNLVAVAIAENGTLRPVKVIAVS